MAKKVKKSANVPEPTAAKGVEPEKLKSDPDARRTGAISPGELEKVTAAVTDPWAGLEIPEQFLRNEDNTWKHPPIPGADTTPSKASAPTPNAPTPVVEPPAGDDSGSSTERTSVEPTTSPTALDEFTKFKVDPQEIESQIKREADRRFYQWDKPTKRPTKNAILKQVRKEFYK